MDTKKIAVATDDKISVSEHLGRCKYFAIYTISPDTILEKEFIENTYTPHSQGLCRDGEPEQQKHHHSHADIIQALSECQVVLSRGMGQRIVEDFRKAGINGYVVSDDSSIEEVIAQYLKGDLVINKDPKCNGHLH